MARWVSLLALLVLAAGCEDRRGGAGPTAGGEREKSDVDAMEQCMDACTINVGVCQEGCGNDSECKASCGRANETCTAACTKKLRSGGK